MKSKMGRPPLPAGEAKGRLFQMRLTDSDREDYEAAAAGAGLSLSAWVRDRLSKAAKREAKKA